MKYMVDLNNILNAHKNIILEVLIDYYGKEYSEIIKRRFNNAIFDFSSLPEEDYIFSKKHSDKLNSNDKMIIKLRHLRFKRIQRSLQKSFVKSLIDYLKETMIENIDEIDIENQNFLSLFLDKDFSMGYIDFLGSKYNYILNEPNCPNIIKKEILEKQKQFMEVVGFLGIKLRQLSSEKIESFIEYRKKIQIDYRTKVTQAIKLENELSRMIKKKYNIVIFPRNLGEIAYVENGYSGEIRCMDEEQNIVEQCRFIKLPIVCMMNNGLRGFDVVLIHEIIHFIESEGIFVGIAKNDEINNIINEVRTHMIAINITKKLHELGIFIFDNPDDYKIEGESIYEKLFPLIRDFLGKYEYFLSSCAINNDYKELNAYFGYAWETFSELINVIYNNNEFYFARNFSLSDINFDSNEIINLIKQMELYRENYKKELKKELR